MAFTPPLMALRRQATDPHLAATLVISGIACAVSAVGRPSGTLILTVALAGLFTGTQVALGALPARRRRLGRTGWSLLRLGLALVLAATLLEAVGGPGRPLTSLYLPVVAAAAAVGPVQALVVGMLSVVIYLLPELVRVGDPGEVALRGLALAGVTVFIAVGARWLISTLQSTTRRLRTAIVADRRRSRQIAGLETVGRLLASGGPTSELLGQVTDVIAARFGYAYVSIYLSQGTRLVLGAQRGYDQPITEFDGTRGVIGRVMRTRQLAFVPSVAVDGDYVSVEAAVTSKICAPLQSEAQFLGVLNIESVRTLDNADRGLVATIASRIASAVALGRERQALQERAELFRRLHEFGEGINANLAVDRLAEALVERVADVVHGDTVAVTVLDRGTGRYVLRAATDTAPEVLGREVRLGEGLAGRALRQRTVVVDEHFGPLSYPVAYRTTEPQRVMALGVGVPLLRDGVALGALTIARADPGAVFRPIELEALSLVSSHAALALANAFLHADVEELAIRDSLTGLYNRRYFDEALDHMLALRARLGATDRGPLSLIMFDVDHFGDFNKLHGHQVGDMVLREVGQVLRARFRRSDIVARFGGEEFVALLGGSSLADAVAIAEEVRVAVAARTVAGEENASLSVRVSAGCAQLDDLEPTREQLLRTADVALFMAKRAGRDRVVAA